jgi:glycosyltransferase involved in cell wall biosynthesis
MWPISHPSELSAPLLIAHDFAYQYGGAERVTQALGEAFPGARVLVIGGDRTVLARMGVADRATSVLPLGWSPRGYRYLAPLCPLLLAGCRADVVVSSSYAFAHHVRARALHVEYCHSPLRQVWVAQRPYEEAAGVLLRLGMKSFAGWLRQMDLRAVARVDRLVASCENVRGRIKRVYGRDAAILYPPVRTDVFFDTGSAREPDLCLVVARLVEPYKAVGSLVRLFSRLPYRLVVVGDGRDAALIRRHAPRNVSFVGALADDELRDWYSRAATLIFPGEDDFGLVPVEAMACGTPVVALDAGGARETVLQDETGVRFQPGQLETALRVALGRDWDHEQIRRHAAQFGKERFIRAIRQLVFEHLGSPVSDSRAATPQLPLTAAPLGRFAERGIGTVVRS